MKALDEYFLIVVFKLLLNRVHGFANFMLNLKAEKRESERVQNTTTQAQSAQRQLQFPYMFTHVLCQTISIH